MRYVLCHGFGFSDDYWNNLLRYLNGEIIFFRDGLTLDDNIDYVGIGHSLGFQKLNNSNISFKLLVGICGFLNFCGSEKNENQMRRKNLDKMIQMFTKNSELALATFYKSIGYQNKSHKKIAKRELIADLESMKHSYDFCNLNTIIINSTRDKIVPRSITEDNFAAHNKISINYIDCDSHMIGFDFCCDVLKIIQMVQQ